MSSTTAITSAALVLAGLVVAVRLIRLAWRIDAERARTAEARARVGLLPPAPDNQPGTNNAALGECAQIWSLPARHPGLDRLRQAIRDEQQNGDTQ